MESSSPFFVYHGKISIQHSVSTTKVCKEGFQTVLYGRPCVAPFWAGSGLGTPSLIFPPLFSFTDVSSLPSIVLPQQTQVVLGFTPGWHQFPSHLSGGVPGVTPGCLPPLSPPLPPPSGSSFPPRLPSLPYAPSLASIIIDLGLQDPRMHHQQFLQLPPRVRTAIVSWSHLPSDNFMHVQELEAHTDGSATMTDQWPQIPSSAGWSIVLVARDIQGKPWFLGALWGPLSILPSSKYFLGASRPTSPVAEMSAPSALLLMLRATHMVLPLRCYTDSTNTAAHINTLQKATGGPRLVNNYAKTLDGTDFRHHLRLFIIRATLAFPPNECADVTANMGRKAINLPQAIAQILTSGGPTPPMPDPPQFIALSDALYWT